MRIGVNHGSLSDRIMSRYGNSAPGMVESVMEFLRIADTAILGIACLCDAEMKRIIHPLAIHLLHKKAHGL